MRIQIFHGYLLRGTGSNIYNVNLAEALARLGHEVDMVCQDRAWKPPEGVTVHNPDIGRILPVYVADEYEGFEAKPFSDLTDAELDHYIEANVAAILDLPAPDVALANHLIMGPLILARALAGRAPYAVKVHGSALEYTVRPNPRFLPYALEGIRGASRSAGGVPPHRREPLGGAQRTSPTCPSARASDLPAWTFTRFAPARPTSRRWPRSSSPAQRRPGAVRRGAAEAVRALDPERDRIVSFVGKLIVSKGVDLLLAAWPSVVAEIPDARLVIVGFGNYRDTMRRFVDAIRRRDLDDLRDIAARGRELEGGPPGQLRYLSDFLERVDDAWLAAAPAAADRIHFTGRLEYEDLPDLLPVCEAQVMPSTFPEAFGMVAAEAAACGVLPLSAHHSGMAEVTATLAPALPEHLRPLLAFQVGPDAVDQIATKLVAWMRLDPQSSANAPERRWPSRPQRTTPGKAWPRG